MINGSATALSMAIEKQLPVAAQDVLLLGEVTAAMAHSLQARGHRLTVLSWLEARQQLQKSTGAREELLLVNLSATATADKHFDAAVVLDFSPELHPLALFDPLSDLLTEGGVLLLAGQQAEDALPRRTHWLDDALAIAGRCGLAVQATTGDHGVAAGDKAGSFIHVLRKSGPPRWRIGHVMATDFEQVAKLFQVVFAHPLSPELWAWKYAGGRGNAVIARRGGEVIAHYGGMYRDVLIQGRLDWVFQICDVMVHPNERGVLTRQGPFLLTAATSAELYGPLGFGFPNARAMKVAEKMGLYAPADQMAEVHWSPSSTSVRLRSRVRPVCVAASDHASVNALWLAMAHDLKEGVVGVRDWTYVEHRYVNHPLNQYDVLMVTARLSGKPLGVVVLRRHENGCELMDVIAPLANLPLVIDQARRMTARWGLSRLYCWVTQRHASRFVDCAGKEEALDVMIPTSCWTDDPRADALKGKWWLMSGDTDFR